MDQINIKSIIRKIIIFIKDVFVYIFQIIDAFILLPLKLLIGIVFILFIIFLFSNLFIFPAIFERDNDHSEAALTYTISNLLGFEDSYTKSDKSDRLLLKQEKLPENPSNIGDLVLIPYEEWKKIKCWHNDGYYRLQALKEVKISGYTDEDQIKCLKPFRESSVISDEIPYKCNHFNCNAIKIYINEYVLKYPAVLKNLMNIAEKPCEYVRERPQSLKDENYHLLGTLRDELFCDGGKILFYQSPIKFTDIRIVNKKGVVEYNILVDRKDNINVRNKPTFLMNVMDNFDLFMMVLIYDFFGWE